MNDDELTEFEQSLAMLGPAEAALSWVSDTLAGDFDSSWQQMDASFRLVFVQEWISSNPRVMDLVTEDRDSLAALLAEPQPKHPLWQQHGRRVLKRNVERLVESLKHGNYGTGQTPRPVPPDLELVVLFDLDGLPVDDRDLHYLPPGEGRPCVTVGVRYVDGTYRVRTAGAGLYEPGWPPRFVDLPT